MQSILICDDDPDIRRAMKRTLRGYHVVEAGTPGEAMELLRARPFDALVSDFNLGPDEIDGLALLMHVKLNHPEVVRFLVTGSRDLEIATRAVNEGSVHHYFLKPWNDDKLRAALLVTLGAKA